LLAHGGCASDRHVTRPYKITRFDANVQDVAARFHIAYPQQILEMNLSVFPSEGALTDMPASAVGQVIDLPEPATEPDFALEYYVSTGGQTLAALCATKNKDRRIDPSRGKHPVATPPWLTPDYLLNLYENAELRAGHGPDPSTVTLTRGEVVNIPFPAGSGGPRSIAAIANGQVKVIVPPPWVLELMRFYESIRSRTRAFEAGLARLRTLQQAGMREAQGLIALQGVLALTIEHPAAPAQLIGSELASLRQLDRDLGYLVATAMNTMVTHVCDELVPDDVRDVLAIGQGILDDLRSDFLKERSAQLKKEAARYARASNELCDVLAYAYQTLADSPLHKDAGADIRAAAEYLAGVRPVDVSRLDPVDRDLASAVRSLSKGPVPDLPLGTMISLLQVTGATVGNLPGPSTLAVALVRLHGLYTADAFASQVSVVTAEYSAQSAVFVGLASNALARTAEEQDEVMIAVVRVRSLALSARPLNEVETSGFLSAIDNKLAGTTMASPVWVGGLSLLNVFIIVLARDNIRANGVNANNVASLVGGLAVTGLGLGKLAQLLGYVEEATINGVGRGIAVLGVVMGAAQTWAAIRKSNRDTGDIVGSAVSTLGSILLLMSAAPEPASPFLAVAGGALIVGSAVYQAIHDGDSEQLKNLFRSDAKVWWLGQEKAMRAGRQFGMVQSKIPALAAKAAAFHQAIVDADFVLIDASRRGDLTHLVAPQDLDKLAAEEPS
jgi:hypothetical protein